MTKTKTATAKTDPSCKHRWKRTAYSMGRKPEIFYRCSKCEESKNEAATGEVAKRIQEASKRMWKEAGNVHKVWHALLDTMMKRDKVTKRMEWRKRGYDLQLVAEQFAKKHRGAIDLVSVDDSYHMSSDLLLVRHCSPTQWMGVTMLFIPQNGQDPAEIFLYPEAVDSLVQVLRKIQRQSKIIKRKEAAERRRTDPFRKSTR